MRSLCLVFTFCAFCPTVASADEMVVGNATEHAIIKLRVPASGSDPTTEILNPGQTIDPGRTLSLEYDPNTDGCSFDIWAQFANDLVKIMGAYNPCGVDLNDQEQWAIFRD